MGIASYIKRKKDGCIRLCGDYRHLNAEIENDPYCMPRPEKVLDRVGKTTSPP